MPYDLYLSSTLIDLIDERDAAKSLLAEHGISVRQSYQASEDDLVTSCLDDVSDCALYVGIVGMRYGHCPPDAQRNPKGLSITQLEFERARSLKIPCLVFIKSEGANYRLASTDAYTGENGAGARIRAFRQWLAAESGVRPAEFSTLQELREKLLAGALRHKQLRHGAHVMLRSELRHRAELRADVGLVMHPAADSALVATYRALVEQQPVLRVKPVILAPDDARYLAKLDEATLDCCAVAWLMTPTVLASYRDQGALMPRALADQRRRHGEVAVLFDGGLGPFSWPAAWGQVRALEADSVPQVSLTELRRLLRSALEALRHGRWIGVPCLVLAMTLAEAQALADDPSLMDGVADPAERALRQGQLAQMLAALRPAAAPQAWPVGAYGALREDWRPFGLHQPAARDFLGQALARFNEAEPSKRDRLFMKGGADERLRVQWLHYALDELIDDLRGSAEAVMAARDRGCLVLVDELALLHPRLRGLAKQLLRGENVAVLSSQPADPAPYPVSAAFTPESPLQVGSLVTRFQDEHDPRCELAINSPQRLQRWLRLVIPELVPTLGGEEAQTSLVHRADELFG